MEPLSILGAAGSIISTIDVASRCISSLHTIQQRWHGADLTVALLSGHISTVKAALGQIAEFIQDRPLDEQLVKDFELALVGCKLLLAFVDEHVTGLVTDDFNELSFGSKACAVLEDKKVQGYVNHLNNQAGALNLLLTAMSCRSLYDRQASSQNIESRRIVDKIKDDSSSLVCLRGSSSFHSGSSFSMSSGSSSQWSRTFDFDDDLLTSRIYQGQFRMMMKRATRKRMEPEQHMRSTAIRKVSGAVSKNRAIPNRVKPEQPGRSTSSQRESRMAANFQGRGSGQVLISGPHGCSTISFIGDMQSVLDPMAADRRYRQYGGFIVRLVLRAFLDFLRRQDIQHLIAGRGGEEVMRDVLPYEFGTSDHLPPQCVTDALITLSELVCWKARRPPDDWQGYFFDSISRISQPKYSPTITDIEMLHLARPELEVAQVLDWQLVRASPVETLKEYVTMSYEGQRENVAARLIVINLLDMHNSARAAEMYGIFKDATGAKPLFPLMEVQAHILGECSRRHPRRPTMVALLECERFLDASKFDPSRGTELPQCANDGDQSWLHNNVSRAMLKRQVEAKQGLCLYPVRRQDEQETRRVYEAMNGFFKHDIRAPIREEYQDIIAILADPESPMPRESIQSPFTPDR